MEMRNPANWAPGDLSDLELEGELCGLAARVAVTMCRFLLAVAEYDRRRTWAEWECHDMAMWLSWKCGISPVTAREQVRVARAIERLPLVTEWFSAGALSYSQVRAIARVATPGTEEELVEMAAISTAAQLEAATRAFRRTRQQAKDVEKDRYTSRYLRVGWDDDGNLVGRFSFPPEDGAMFAAAIEAQVAATDVDEANADGAKDPHGAARADALIEMIRTAAAAGDDGDDDDAYLVTIIAEPGALKAEAGRATTTSGQRRLCTGVVGSESGESSSLADQRADGGAEADQDEALVCQISDGPGLAAETVRRIACDATAVIVTERADGRILDLGRRTRRPNRALRRALRIRDGHCQFPGCSRRRTQAHHIHHWIDGGTTRLDNLISLCSRHHHRLHEGGFTMTVGGRNQIRFIHRSGYEIEAAPVSIASGTDPDRLPGSDLDPVPYQSGWDGTRLNLGWAVERLLQADGYLPLTPGPDQDRELPPTIWQEVNPARTSRSAHPDTGAPRLDSAESSDKRPIRTPLGLE